MLTGFKKMQQLTLDAFGMILNTMHVIMLIAVYHGKSFGLNIRPTLIGIHRLHDDHISTIATFLDEPACSSACLEG